jgi:murein DD-endopeptidase MepM/ murein hydrolase activator NlpD
MMNMGNRSSNSLKKICSSVLATLVLYFALSAPLAASTLEDKQKEAGDLKTQISQVDSELARCASGYEEAYVRLTEINCAIQMNLAELDKSREELARNRKLLGDRIDSIYRNGNLEVISVILGAQDYESFLSRLDYLRKVCEEDMTMLGQIKKLKEEQEKRDAQLAENKAKQRVALNKIQAEKTSMERALEEKQEILASVNNEIKTLDEEERRRQEEERRKALAALAAANKNNGSNGGQGGGAPSSSFVPDSSFSFPVTSPYSYCDSWHAPRVGHLHQGTDIFALRGTPARACVNGQVLRMSNGKLGGIGITLIDHEGNTYYYGHLDGYAAGVSKGMQVSSGQIIGYVGDTGNAKGTPPHVHFEIHPGGGSATNPYPILKLVG